MDESQKELYRQRISHALNIYNYFSHEEVLSALLFKEKGKLAAISKMKKNLDYLKEDFETVLDTDDPDQIDIAIRTFVRPSL